MSTTLSSTSIAGSEPAVGARRVKAKSGRLGILLTLAVVAVLAVAAVPWVWSSWGAAVEGAAVDKYVVEPRPFTVVLKEKGELRAFKSTDVKSEVEGRATIISLIEEGAVVNKGDLLVELASDEIDERILQQELKESNSVTLYESAKAELDIQRDRGASDIRKAELAIELKQLELDKYLKGEWAQKLKDAEIAIEEAEITLERETEDFEAAKKLFEREFITETEYEQDEFNSIKARWGLDKARMAKEVLEKYSHVAQLRICESDLEEAKKECERVRKSAAAEEAKRVRAVDGAKRELDLTVDQLNDLRAQKDKCRITAPTPGFVVYYCEPWGWRQDDQIKEGTEVHERQVLIQLPDTSVMTVLMRVHEAKTSRLSVGQSAVVEVEGIPGEQFTGKVTKIAVIADTQNRWLNPDLREYETEVTLDPSDIPLKPGVTARVEILVDEVDAELAVPVQTIYSKRGKRYVFRETPHGVEHAEVELGAVSTEWAEVKAGVAVGDQVLLAFADEHTRLIPDEEPNPPGHGARARVGSAGGGDGLSKKGAEKADAGEHATKPAAAVRTASANNG